MCCTTYHYSYAELPLGMLKIPSQLFYCTGIGIMLLIPVLAGTRFAFWQFKNNYAYDSDRASWTKPAILVSAAVIVMFIGVFFCRGPGMLVCTIIRPSVAVPVYSAVTLCAFALYCRRQFRRMSATTPECSTCPRRITG